jgi:hypothetical protein
VPLTTPPGLSGHDGRCTAHAVDRDASKHIPLGMGQVAAGRASRRRSRAPRAEWAASVWPRSRCHLYPSLGDGRIKGRIVEQCRMDAVRSSRIGRVHRHAGAHTGARMASSRRQDDAGRARCRRTDWPLGAAVMRSFMRVTTATPACPEGLSGAGPGKTRQQYDCADFASSGSRRLESP